MIPLLRHLVLFAAYGLLGVLLAVGAGFAFYLSRLPPLMPWHEAPLAAEFRAADAARVATIADYRALEAKLAAELDAEVYANTPASARTAVNRYSAGSLADPRQRKPDWNRTFEMPAPRPKGAALLLHGLSDSPYSMRALAEVFARRGWTVVGLRLPGHGTAPAALTRVSWEDWAAATRMAAKDLRAKAGPDAPLVIAGYSTGAALAVEYALAALQGEPLPKPAGLVLLSPAIGVSPAAAYAVWSDRLARWLGVRELAWTDLAPEFDPYKYNSFAANAADQIYRLTLRIRERLDEAGKGGAVSGMPPLLAFQSEADATVSTRALLDTLFRRLAPEGHALVGFGLNRASDIEPLLVPGADESKRLLEGPPMPFDLTVLRNADGGDGRKSEAVVALHRAAGSASLETLPTGLVWPPTAYSLSHVALPFRADDPVYGERPPRWPWKFIFLGHLAFYGERDVLQVPPGNFARLRHNPFFPYVESRVNAYLETLEAKPGPGAPR